MFKTVKKGSQKYKKILLKSTNTNSAPRKKIEKDWKISEKTGRENFFEKAFSFWKNSFLPAKIQLILLKICNHHLKLNSQLKHFARDENGDRVKPECTFCTLSQEENPDEESYRHFFLECKHSRNTFIPVSNKYNIPIPNTISKGELILYFFSPGMVSGMKLELIFTMLSINTIFYPAGLGRFYRPLTTLK